MLFWSNDNNFILAFSHKIDPRSGLSITCGKGYKNVIVEFDSAMAISLIMDLNMVTIIL